MAMWDRSIDVEGLGECWTATDMPLFLYQTDTSQVGPRNRAGLMAFKARAQELLTGTPLSEDALAIRLAELVGGERHDTTLQAAFIRCFGSQEAGTGFLKVLQWGLGGDPPCDLRPVK